MKTDCIIVGGGVAGLSAGLVLGRSRRRVVVCDAGRPRNSTSKSVHCFPGREGVSPADLLEICRRELLSYPDVSIVAGTVEEASTLRDGFSITVNGRRALEGRSLILATGLVDKLPDVPG